MPRTNSQSQDNYHHPHDVDELTHRNIETIVDLERAAKAERTHADRIADIVSSFCGSMYFVWFHILWFGTWVSFNTLLSEASRFDPFPFTFLTLVVSLEAIFLSAFIMISQNQQTRLDTRRNHLDLQINLLAEQENTKMLQMLQRIAQAVGAPVDNDPDISTLEEATRPDKLLEQIDDSIALQDEKDRRKEPVKL